MHPLMRLLLWACALGLPLQAGAHAVLMDSAPKAQQQLSAAPTEVSVTFNEGVGPIFFRVLDRAGAEVGKPGEIRLDGNRMVMPLGEALPNGSYLMTYRVISADTHPVGAAIPFSVGEPLTDLSATASAGAATSSMWTLPVALNRWMLYVSMLLAAGSALFVLLMPAPAGVAATALRVGRWSAAVAAIAYLLALGLGGAEMNLGGAAALFDPASWQRGAASTLLPSAVIGVPAMLLLFWACGQGVAPPKFAVLGLGAALGIASFLVTGHAATAAPVWMMATSVGVHLTAAAFWLGALWPLARSTQLLAVRESGALLTAFSVRAAWAVAGIVASGALITWTQVQSPANLLGTDYGQGLLRKLFFFGVLLALAAANKWWLTPALERGDAAAATRIGRTIRVELGVYAIILLGAMSLTLATPPRAVAQSGAMAGTASAAAGAMPGGELTGKLEANGYTAEYQLSSAKAGENMIMVTVRGPDGQVLLDMADLEVVPSLEAAGIQDIRIKGEKVEGGMWHAMIQEMIIPGQWTLGIDAFVTDYDKVEFRGTVEIR
jgi:copper transport protein